MSIAYAQGFENSIIASDLMSMGLWANTSNSANNRYGQATSAISTGRATSGRSYVYANPLTTTLYPGVTGSSGDPGYIQLPKTINQLWTAGGFVLGFAAKFNRWSGQAQVSGQLERIGGGVPGPCAALVNGVLYTNRVIPITAANTLTYNKWNTTTYNWDPVGSITPSVIAQTNGKVITLGAGEVAFASIGPAGTVSAGYVSYTNNNGATTTAWQIGSGFSVYGGTKTNGRTTDYYLFSNSNSSATPTLYASATLGGAITSFTLPTGANAPVYNFINITGGPDAGKTVVLPQNAGGYWYTPTTTAAANTGSSWTFFSTTPVIYEVYWSASASLYIWQTSTGTYTSTALGGALTATQTALPFSQTAVLGSLRYGVWGTGRATIHVSQDDGRTWNTAFTATPGVSISFGYCTQIFSDGTYLYVFQDSVGLLRSSDGFTWSYVYSCEWAENSTNNIYSPTGLFCTTQSSTSTHALNTTSASPAFAMITSTQSTGAVTRSLTLRGFTLGTAGSTFATVSSPINNVGGWHYFELEFTPTATGNTFTGNIWIDGTLAYTSGTTSFLLASSTTDTTTYPFFNVGRGAQWTGFDDIVLIVKDGVGTSGPTGGLSILPRRLNGDVAANWTRNPGNLGSNAAAVNSGGLSASNALNGAGSVVPRRVSTDTDGARDEYSSSSAVAAQGRVLGVLTEAFYTLVSGTQALVNQGVTYGGVDALTQQTVTVTSPSYFQTINETAPGGAAWNTASADGCDFTQVKVS